MTNRICYLIYIKDSIDDSPNNVDALYFTGEIETSIISDYPNLRFAFSSDGSNLSYIDREFTFDEYTSEYFSGEEGSLSMSFMYY